MNRTNKILIFSKSDTLRDTLKILLSDTYTLILLSKEELLFESLEFTQNIGLALIDLDEALDDLTQQKIQELSSSLQLIILCPTEIKPTFPSSHIAIFDSSSARISPNDVLIPAIHKLLDE